MHYWMNKIQITCRFISGQVDDEDTTFEMLEEDEEDEYYDEDESPTDQLDLVEMEELNEQVRWVKGHL